jgi:hypothetical protein
MPSKPHQLCGIAWVHRRRAGALVVPAAFAGSHAKTATEAPLRGEPSRAQAMVRSLENGVGVLRPVPVRITARPLPNTGASPAA